MSIPFDKKVKKHGEDGCKDAVFAKKNEKGGEMKKAIQTKVVDAVVIQKLSYPIDNTYKYDASLFRSVDGGKTFYHCGHGKYCKTLSEARDYKAQIEKDIKKEKKNEKENDKKAYKKGYNKAHCCTKTGCTSTKKASQDGQAWQKERTSNNHNHSMR